VSDWEPVTGVAPFHHAHVTWGVYDDGIPVVVLTMWLDDTETDCHRFSMTPDGARRLGEVLMKTGRDRHLAAVPSVPPV
jgi:hypothetical protein